MPHMVEEIRNELRSCVRRGVQPPNVPDAVALWNATGGDGPLALLCAVEFYTALREFKLERQRERERAWRERREYAA